MEKILPFSNYIKYFHHINLFLAFNCSIYRMFSKHQNQVTLKGNITPIRNRSFVHILFLIPTILIQIVNALTNAHINHIVTFCLYKYSPTS